MPMRALNIDCPGDHDRPTPSATGTGCAMAASPNAPQPSMGIRSLLSGLIGEQEAMQQPAVADER